MRLIEAVKDRSLLFLEISLHLRRGRERLHTLVVKFVISALESAFLEISPGLLRRRFRSDYVGILRRAVPELPPFHVQPLLLRRLA